MAWWCAQVPAFAAGDRQIPDLLGITRQGRLVVIDRKASEDIQLPSQAVDYGLRVRFGTNRKGTFNGLDISKARKSIPGRRWSGWLPRPFIFIPQPKPYSKIFVARNSDIAHRPERKRAPRD